MDVGFLYNRSERPLGTPSRLKERGEVATVPHPRDLQLNSPDPRVPDPLAVAIALARTSEGTLVAGSA